MVFECFFPLRLWSKSTRLYKKTRTKDIICQISTCTLYSSKSPPPRSLTDLRRQTISKTANSSKSNDSDVDSPEESPFLSEFLDVTGAVQHVFLIQPKPKFVPGRKLLTTVELQMEENKTLVETLGWEVVDSIVLNVSSFSSSEIFGKGNSEKLRNAINSCRGISGIFFGSDILMPKHIKYFKEEYGLPLYDRYRIVLEIFRSHAKTKEAKLQVALAELPYIRSCIFGYHQDGPMASSSFDTGSGETKREIQRQMIIEREKKLKEALSRVRANRDILRKSRVKNQINSIAVVGYTNAGKTSLIKALTGDASLIPEDKLFATLDVTSHAGVLPSNIRVLFMDTIGFISDIPPTLIASFSAVLEEVLIADVIVHVRDISHPDTIAQKATVIQQLQSLNISAKLMENIVEVCNKIDKLDYSSWTPEKFKADPNAIPTSAVSGMGIYDLRERIEDVLLRTSGLLEKAIRIPQCGEELQWLYKDAHVHYVEADPDNSEFLVAFVTITEADFARFVHKFRKVMVRNR